MAEELRKIKTKAAELDDLLYALRSGARDFTRAPLFGLFFGGVFALGGVVLIYATLILGIYWLSYPLIIGFSLLGPFIAIGLYEVSRRIEAGLELGWRSGTTNLCGPFDWIARPRHGHVFKRSLRCLSGQVGMMFGRGYEQSSPSLVERHWCT